jgi:hypothetical protein
MFKEYITSVINNHEKNYNLIFNESIRNEIENNINDGIYAFQLIYFFDSEILENQIDEIKKLDHKLCIHEDYLTHWGSNKMWSYDGGQRYQWSEVETLVFDTSIIRDIKIENIL